MHYCRVSFRSWCFVVGGVQSLLPSVLDATNLVLMTVIHVCTEKQ
jgi:hypothetical protein